MKHDIWMRLRSAILGWKAEVSAGQESLAAEIGTTSRQLLRLLEVLNSRTENTIALAAAQEELERIKQILAQHQHTTVFPPSATGHSAAIEHMRQDLHATYVRLSETIGLWTAEVSRGQAGLSKQIEEATGQLSTLLTMLETPHLEPAKEPVRTPLASFVDTQEQTIQTLRREKSEAFARAEALQAQCDALQHKNDLEQQIAAEAVLQRDSLEHQISDLVQELDLAKTREEELEELKQRCSELSAQAQAAEQDIAQARSDLESLERQCTQERTERIAAQTETENLRSECLHGQARLNDLDESFQAASTREELRLSEIRGLADQLAEHEKKREEQRVELLNIRQEKDDLHNALAQERAAVESARNHAEVFQSECQQLQARIMELEESLRALRAREEQQASTLSEQAQEIEKYRQEKDEFSAALATAHADAQSLRESLAARISEVETAAAEGNRLQMRVQELEEHLAHSKLQEEQYAAQAQQMSQTQELQRNAIEQHSEALQQAQSETLSLREALNARNGDYDRALAECQQLRSDIETMRLQSAERARCAEEEWTKQIQIAADALSQEQAARQSVQDENAALRLECEQIQTRVLALEDALRDAKLREEQYAADLQKISQSAELLRAEALEKSSALLAAQSDLQSLREALAARADELDGKNAELERLHQDAAEKENTLNQTFAQLHSLQTALDEADLQKAAWEKERAGFLAQDAAAQEAMNAAEQEKAQIQTNWESAQQQLAGLMEQERAWSIQRQALESGLSAAKEDAALQAGALTAARQEIETGLRVRDELSATITQQALHNTELQSELDALHAHLAQLSEKEADSASRLAEAQDALDSTRQELAHNATTLSDLFAETTRQRAELHEKDLAASLAQIRLQDLEGQYAAASEETDALRRRLHSAEEESVVLTNTVTSLRAEADAQAAVLTSVQTQLHTVEQLLSESEETLVRKNAALLETEQKIAELTAGLSEAHAQLASYETRRQEDENRHRTLESALRESQARAAEYENDLIAQNDALQQAHAHVSALEQHRSDLTQRIEGLNASLAEAQREQEETAHLLSVRIADLQEAQDTLEAAQIRNVELDRQVAEIQEIRKQQSETLNDLELQRGQFLRESQAWSQERAQTEESIARFTERLETSDQRILDLEQEIDQHRIREQEMVVTIGALRADLEQAHSNHGHTMSDLQEAQARLAQYQQALEERDQGIAGLRAKLLEGDAALDAMNMRAGHIDAEKNRLQIVLDTAQSQNIALETMIAETQALLAETQHDRDRCAQAMAELKQQTDSKTAIEASLRETLAQRETELLETISDLGAALQERDDVREQLARATSSQGRLTAGIAGIEPRRSPRIRVESAERRQRIVLSEALRGAQKEPIGEILVNAGIITEKQLRDALRHQRRAPDQLLGAILVDMEYTGEEAVAQAVACQLDIPFVEPDVVNVDPEAAALMNRDLCTWHVCIPMRITAERFVVAMANPQDETTLHKLKDISRREIVPMVATASDILTAVEDVYGVY